MSLLFSQEIKDQLAQELHAAISEVHIVSAYCKHNAMVFIEDYINLSVQKKKLLVRFSFHDIVSGASDLAVYEFCVEHDWEMYIRLDLHAKTYIFDKIRCIVGSANATSRGIGLINNPNYEIAHFTEINANEMQKIDDLFESAVLMTDELYHKMKNNLNTKTIGDISENDNWDDDILKMFIPKVNVLFTYEFPNCTSLSNLKGDSLEFLMLKPGWDMKTLKTVFMSSNAFIWLEETLEKSENNELYFGALTALLHDTLINDPRPYRKEVKELLANFLNWIDELNIEKIIIDRPKHSQRIRLVK